MALIENALNVHVKRAEMAPERSRSRSPEPPLDVTLRAGGIVLRTGGRDDDEVSVLLVSRRSAPDSFTVPAGKYEGEADGGCYHSCALRETREEAGVRCEVLYDLGWFARPAQRSHKRSTSTRFFAMRLLAEDDEWLEATERSRQWHPLKKAQALVQHNDMLAKVLQHLEAALPEIDMVE